MPSSHDMLENALERSFDEATCQKGLALHKAGCVDSYDIGKSTIEGRVLSTGKKFYDVKLLIEPQRNFTIIDAQCTCNTFYNCQHAAAIVFEILLDSDLVDDTQERSAEVPLERLDYVTQDWLEQFSQLNSRIAAKPNADEVVLYLLEISHIYSHKTLVINTQICKRLKDGSLGKAKAFHPSTESRKARVSQETLEVFALLTMFAKNDRAEGQYHFSEKNIDRLLKRLIDTGQCYWQNTLHAPLSLSDPRPAEFSWQLDDQSMQTLHCNLHDAGCVLLPLIPLWYIDPLTQQMGNITTALPDKIVNQLLNAPQLTPQAAKHIEHVLQQAAPSIPLPKVYQSVIQEQHKVIPCLHLFSVTLPEIKKYSWHSYLAPEEKRYALVELSFCYGTRRVAWRNDMKTLSALRGDALVTIPRDFPSEVRYRERLSEHVMGLVRELYYSHYLNSKQAELADIFLIAEEENHDVLIGLSESVLPLLRKAGWQITYAKDYPFQEMIEATQWYGDLQESSDYDWFNFELGVMIDGERVSLLNPLLHFIKTHPINQVLEHYKVDDDKKFVFEIAPGKLLAVSSKRMLPILHVLYELYTPKAYDENSILKVSRLRAGLLIEMETALHASELRWFGSSALLDLGRRLQDFSGIKPVKIPKSFKATLRPYQQEGVNWLQFLRDYQLNGILADDMGLGKTVQTLAHILVEKHAKRLTKPCLIIAPTSVIANWRIEASRFAPSLNVLLLHGSERQAHFDVIQDHDIVLTTYPLLIRDQAILLKESFHTIILDEAQYIKNAQAKMTQIVQQLSAEHRLCLTGTPMENHLGELWSLYHFLMPGLLGSVKAFNSRYRTPIEKHADRDVQAQLGKMIKPFMLRRTKSDVVLELPAKTDIIHSVELEAQQRDLYESIRLAMHEKVKKAIDKQGVERSQIIILDALLKLRQVCCDPRLLKLEGAKKVSQSAKLLSLMELLPAMLQEGRRILLFSQFTSMLSLIEAELNERAIPYLKLTGQTKDRLSLINAFQANEVPLFLISLKAGGTGLNLTAADTVIHYDPWWNPAVENQATDRAHRIGQEKAVFVYKLVTQGTVEEKILAMQDKKKSLMDALFSDKENKAAITKEDFDALFSQ